MYIAIEGVKGVGKSTVVSHLELALRADGLEFVLVAPTRHLSGEEAENSRDCDLTDFQREAVYAARSNLHSQAVDWTAPLILGDRSFYTSLATRWDPERSAELVSRCRALESLIRIPDHVIHLVLPVDVVVQRLLGREREFGKQDESRSRIEAVDAAYRQIGRRCGAFGFQTVWHRQDANSRAEQVATRCYQLVRRIVGLRAKTVETEDLSRSAPQQCPQPEAQQPGGTR